MFIFNDYHLYEVPNRFSYQHILLIIIDVIYILLLVHYLKKTNYITQKKVLLGLSIATILIFAGRMFFGWEGSKIYQNGSKTSLLPFELCNINILVTFAALLINKKFLNNYMYFVTMIGGFIPLLVFPDCHMITNGNNLFHYMFIDYWFIHTQLFAIPIVMIACGWFKPNIKQIPFVIITVFCIYTFAFLASLILKNFKSFEVANYMYCLRDNNLPILRELHKIIPVPYLYGLPLVIPVTGLFYLMVLPFIKKNTKKEEKCNE